LVGEAMATAIVQARLGSTRLPGKVLKELVGRPLLWHVFDKLKYSKKIQRIILATTTSVQDDQLEDFAQKNGISCFRGEEEDVLARFYGAAKHYKCTGIIIRVSSDEPLIDPNIVDRVIDAHLAQSNDYTSIGVANGFPLGLDTEAFNFAVLERAFNEASLAHEREHVTPYIYQHPDIFKIGSIEAEGKLKRPELRLTVDTEEDLRLIREIYASLYHPGRVFCTEDVIDLIDKRPELAAINAHIKQKELGQ